MAKENVIKTVVRSVVREELATALQKQKTEIQSELKTELIPELSEIIERKIEEPFRQFRDEIFTKMDKFLKMYQDHEIDHAANLARHDDYEERISSLEKIHPHSQHGLS